MLVSQRGEASFGQALRMLSSCRDDELSATTQVVKTKGSRLGKSNANLFCCKSTCWHKIIWHWRNRRPCGYYSFCQNSYLGKGSERHLHGQFKKSRQQVMKLHRHGKHQRPFSNYFRHSSYCLAQT